jgi:hypothetical protein
MTEFLRLRTELRMLRPTDLLKMPSKQKDHSCVLNPSGSCQFYFKYKGFGFCVSELSGQGCQAEKAGQGGRMQKLLSPALKLKTVTKRY